MRYVALRRSLVNEIGYPDEHFGLGTLKYNDYWFRVKIVLSQDRSATTVRMVNQESG